MQQLAAFWNRIDAKVKATLLTGVVTFVVTKLAIELDPDVSALITLGIAALAGYGTANEGTVLRTQQLSGNAPQVRDPYDTYVDPDYDPDFHGTPPPDLERP